MPDVRGDLPNDFLLRYGAYTFGPATEIVGFKTVPIPDRAGRTFTALRHTLTVRFWLNSYDGTNPSLTLDNSDNFDENLPQIRAQLMRQADQLVLQSTTFGNYTINGAAVPDTTATKDLIWGPIPKLLDAKGFNSYGAHCTWQVEFCLDPCGGLIENQVMEWDYKLSFSLDASGYTRRTYSGLVSIPMTRKAQTDRNLTGNVDALREKITPPLAIGFRRETQQFDLSDDKRTLTFTIVDSQLPPNIPPAGVVVAEGSHSLDVDWHNPARSIQTIRATYEVSSDRARSEAYEHFRILVNWRTWNARNKAFQNKQAAIFPLRFHVTEPLYERKTAEFAFTYWIQHWIDPDTPAAEAFPPKTLLTDAGLWQALPESDWKSWADSMQKAGVSTPRGTAGLVWLPKEDAIIDLCAGQPAVPYELKVKGSKSATLRTAAFGEVKTDPVNSWMLYELRLNVQVLDNTTVLQRLPTTVVGYSPRAAGFTDSNGYQQPYSGPCNIVQTRGMPRYRLVLSGRALRAGYAIAPPLLLSAAGQAAFAVNDAMTGFRTWIAGNVGVPIVAARWLLKYELPCPPTAFFGPPDNPLLGSVPTTAKLEDGIARG